MSVAIETKQAEEPQAAAAACRPSGPVLGATRYDRVTSLLISLIMLLSMARLGLA